MFEEIVQEHRRDSVPGVQSDHGARLVPELALRRAGTANHEDPGNCLQLWRASDCDPPLQVQGKHGWSRIFGRLLVAWLDQNVRGSPPDLIIANRTYCGDDGAAYGHTERVIEAAATDDVLGEWPFDITDPRAIVKARATPKSAGSRAPTKRAAAAELRDSLAIPDRRRVDGKRILVYDDVCTTGSQLDTVAAVLINEGSAKEVEGIVLARAPWTQR